MGDNNNKIEKKRWEKDSSDSGSTIVSIIDSSCINFEGYNIKGKYKEVMLRSIISRYDQMNQKIQETKKSIKNSQKRTKKSKESSGEKPKRIQKAKMIFDFNL